MKVVDLDVTPLRELNRMLHEQQARVETKSWRITHPRGRHAIAVGIDAALEIEIDGNVGYYCAGMNKQAIITVNGSRDRASPRT